MRAHRDAHALQRFFAVAFGATCDRAGGQILAREIIGIERRGGIAGLVDLIDRHPLLLAELLVQIAPIGGEVGAIARARRHAEIADFQYVAGLGALDIDRAGHDMDAGVAVGLRHLTEDRLDTRVEH